MGSEKNMPLTSKFNVAVGNVALLLLARGIYTQLYFTRVILFSVVCDLHW